jgi:VIT1/CCC1 family predicted Fe2+/Mn2+ transporter
VRGDIFDDLGLFVPAPLRGRPWAFAVVVAVAVALLITAAGVVADDPYDGALRGVADGLACLVGFALLGRYLGLRAAAE